MTEDLDFVAKEKAMAHQSKEIRMLCKPLYTRYRPRREAKCFHIDTELIEIAPDSDVGHRCTEYASRRGWSAYAAAGVIVPRGQKLSERAPRAGTVIRLPVRGGHTPSSYPQGKRKLAYGRRLTRRSCNEQGAGGRPLARHTKRLAAPECERHHR